MKLLFCLLMALATAQAQTTSGPAYVPKQSDRPEAVAGDEIGFAPIFDGKSLAGWEGDPKYWRVEYGCLVGEITPETLLRSNTFIVRGNVLTHLLNGRLMAVVIDDDAPNRPTDGLIGVQVHVGPPMKVEYRNIRLKHW